MLNIQVILGSTRRGRRGENVARWVLERANAASEFQADLVDLADYPLPFYEEETSPAMHRGNYAQEASRRFVQKIAQADGYIIVTPEYNHSFSAVLKNALDHGYHEWTNKPVAFVSYSGGAIGGARAVEQLRLVVIELQMAPIRESIQVGGVRQVFDQQGCMTVTTYDDRLLALFRQLRWWGDALQAARTAT
ncbi:MAG TPA: NAD(P)H-dependent oxidoreductase, partial [Chloroflexota bacterium]|nr:NAD(P)H-dependent oxidoreductase [Chloroflexota bacterium]